MSLGTLTWLGHSTFVLETPGGKRVMFDPFVTGNPATPQGRADPGDLDVILLSHGHSDHTGDVVRLANEKQPKAVVGMIELTDWLDGQGVANTVGMNKGGTAEVEGLRVTMTHAVHSSSVSTPEGSILYLGEPAGLVVKLENGYAVYFAGDTDVFSDMALIRELHEPDMAMLPIGDHFTMGPAGAAKAVELLGVRRVLGMHYGTFPPLVGTPAALRDACSARGLDVTVEELQPGESLR
jgi:L-ascorbate metabolism protein UlaG (beta-lactamase superfamily)